MATGVFLGLSLTVKAHTKVSLSLLQLLVDTLERGLPGEVHEVFRGLLVLVLRTALEFLAGDFVRECGLFPRVEHTDVPRFAGKVELRLLLSRLQLEMVTKLK